MHKEYDVTIGLEVHVELSTRTKIFCACGTAFGQKPNTQICPVCMGLPGTLPVLNRRVVEAALLVGLALNCEVNRVCRFDRKNYFYPDNPQNYQISQLYLPICHDGFVDITDGEGEENEGKKVRIHELHMEEDAGKLIHAEDGKLSLIDYNRAGVPLIEIVTEPDLENGQEVIAFLEKLRRTLQYLGVSDCKLQEGSMRVDVNLSLREKGTDQLGTRTEMKNLNSYHAIMHCIEAEHARQEGILRAGGGVMQETRRFDDALGKSYSMRSKEDAKDYRYFPDPDLGPVRISEEWIERAKRDLPELQEAKKKRFMNQYGLSLYDARMITDAKELSKLFEDTVSCGSEPKKAANWLMGEGFRLLREKELEPKDMALTPEHFAELIRLNEEKRISNAVAKEVFELLVQEDFSPEEYVRERGLLTIWDESVLERAVAEVLAENAKSVEDYRKGKDRALGFLVGQTMKKMKGQADPAVVTRLLKEKLS